MIQELPVDLVPDPAENGQAQPQDHPAALPSPRHPGLLEPLRKDHLAPRLGYPAADRQPGPPVRAVLHLLAVRQQVVVGLLVLPLLPLAPGLPPIVLRRR